MEIWCDADGPTRSESLSRLALKLRLSRKQAGLSLRELSLLTGVPLDVIRDLEMHALTDIDALTVAALSEALKTNLVADSESMVPSNSG